MGKRATIRDVADRAGVSKSTVSLVLHESPLVRAETKAKVTRAIRDLNYVRNRAAAALRNAATHRVGIVVNDLRTPFVADFTAAAQAALMARGYAALVASSGEDPETEDRAVRLMLEHDVAGLIVSPSRGAVPEMFDTVLAASIPVIQVLRQGDARVGRIPFQSMDYAIGSHLAARHLLDQGLRRIAFVGGHTGHQISRERALGFRDIMQVERVKPLVLQGGSSRSFGYNTMLALAADHPDIQGAICINDAVALGMQAAAGRAGRSVGRDFFLVGFDDTEDCAEADPPLSSVRCDVAALAANCVADLLVWIDTGTAPLEISRHPVQLEIRASSRVP